MRNADQEYLEFLQKQIFLDVDERSINGIYAYFATWLLIGEDNLENLDPDTLYFITSILNELNLDSIRNKIILKVLPLKI